MEVFEVNKHPTANRAYAWSYRDGNVDRIMTVMGIPRQRLRRSICFIRGTSGGSLTTVETSLAKAERAYLKIILGSIGAFAFLVLISWGGFRYYRHWDEGHLVRRAQAFMGGGDLKSAGLNAQRALQLNPESAAAARVLAEIAEKAGDRSALNWRRKVFTSNPNSVEDALALVGCALRLHDLPAAEDVLRKIEKIAAGRAEFHAASGRLAEEKKDRAASEQHWAKALELAPDNSGYRFQLALVQIGGSDPAKRAAGLATLEQLRTDPKQKEAATRTLIIDGAAHGGDSQRLRTLAGELQGYPNAPIADRILYLEILRQLHDPAYDDYLSQLKVSAVKKPMDLTSLVSWMIRNKMSSEAIALVEAQPAPAQAAWPVPLAVCEALAQQGDWAQLERLLKTSSWPSFNHLRRAYLARAFRGQARELEAHQELAAAQTEAAANPQALLALARTIADWGWENDAVEMLWMLTKDPDTQMYALQTLYDHYSRIPDTTGLYRTLTRFAEVFPNDPTIHNNLAQISLLLG
ncbi:MAG: hypothetical protein M3Z22_06215, partial [Verrucomicrobiota bacterium]|nr:hypothetical protein [Verrucomicrobiota bacterium]